MGYLGRHVSGHNPSMEPGRAKGRRDLSVPVGILTVGVALLAWWFPRTLAPSSTAETQAVETVQSDVTSPEETRSPEPTTTEPATTIEPTTSPPTVEVTTSAPEPEPEIVEAEDVSSAPAVDLSSISLEAERASNGYGHRVGEDLYALGDDGTLQLDVTWRVYDSDGRAMQGDQCQIVVSLTGPGDDQARRFSRCGSTARAFFRGWPERITVAGDWTIEVIDELTGLTTSLDIEVLEDRDA